MALGAVVSVLVGRALEGLLFEVQSADPLSLGAAAVLSATVALGCLFPAVRAARTNLLAALHH